MRIFATHQPTPPFSSQTRSSQLSPVPPSKPMAVDEALKKACAAKLQIIEYLDYWTSPEDDYDGTKPEPTYFATIRCPSPDWDKRQGYPANGWQYKFVLQYLTRQAPQFDQIEVLADAQLRPVYARISFPGNRSRDNRVLLPTDDPEVPQALKQALTMLRDDELQFHMSHLRTPNA